MYQHLRILLMSLAWMSAGSLIAMQECSASENRLISRDKAAFMGLTIDGKWDRYSRLLKEFDEKEKEVNRLHALERSLRQSLGERYSTIESQENRLKSRDARITYLEKENNKVKWQTIGITFFCTAAAIGIVKLIDKKVVKGE